MKRSSCRLLALVTCALSGAGAAAPKSTAPMPIRIALQAPAIKGGVPERLAEVFEQVVTTEVRKLEGVAAISSGEIAQMLSLERNRQMLGCDEDASSECMAEIANALGAEEALATSITQIGQSFTVDARRVNARKATARSATRQVASRSGEEILALIGPLIQELFPERMLKPGLTRGVDRSVARRINPPPISRGLFFTAVGATVVTAAVGSGFGILARDSHQQYLLRIEGAQDGAGVSFAELEGLRAQTQSRARVANVLLISAGVMAVVTAASGFLTDWENDAAPARPRVTAVVTPSSVGIAGRF